MSLFQVSKQQVKAIKMQLFLNSILPSVGSEYFLNKEDHREVTINRFHFHFSAVELVDHHSCDTMYLDLKAVEQGNWVCKPHNRLNEFAMCRALDALNISFRKWESENRI